MTLPKHLAAPPVRELMRRLRKHAPIGYPVRLVQKKNPVCRGYGIVPGYASVTLRGGRVIRGRIVVDPRLPIGEKWDVIVHEWAHLLDRERRTHRLKNCHDARWGACLARAFVAATTFD